MSFSDQLRNALLVKLSAGLSVDHRLMSARTIASRTYEIIDALEEEKTKRDNAATFEMIEGVLKAIHDCRRKGDNRSIMAIATVFVMSMTTPGGDKNDFPKDPPNGHMAMLALQVGLILKGADPINVKDKDVVEIIVVFERVRSSILEEKEKVSEGVVRDAVC